MIGLNECKMNNEPEKREGRGSPRRGSSFPQARLRGNFHNSEILFLGKTIKKVKKLLKLVYPSKTPFLVALFSDNYSIKALKMEEKDKYIKNNLDMFSPFSIFAVSNNTKDTKNEQISQTGETNYLQKLSKGVLCTPKQSKWQ